MKFFAQRANRDRECQIWHAAFERSADGILVLSGPKIVDCNGAAVRFGGYRSKAELLSRSPADMAPEFQPDGRRSSDHVKEMLPQVSKDGYARFEWIFRRAGGQTVPVQVTLVAAELDGEPVVISHLRDIADLIAAREEKKQTIAKLANEFEETVGSIANAVSSAAKNVETTAGSLSSAAEKGRAACLHCGGGLVRGIHQCPVGRRRDRRALELGRRNQPPGRDLIEHRR